MIDYDKSDAWSSGMMFYRVLARGAAPFPGEDPRAFADEDYRELPAAGVGSGLRRIVRGLLRVDPAARLSAAAALGELRACPPPIFAAAADGAASRALQEMRAALQVERAKNISLEDTHRRLKREKREAEQEAATSRAEVTDLRAQLAAALRGGQRAVRPPAPPAAKAKAIERVEHARQKSTPLSPSLSRLTPPPTGRARACASSPPPSHPSVARSLARFVSAN